MDAPLLVQPIVIPHEAQPQAHNLEVCWSFPLEFFQKTAGRPKASNVKCVELVKDRLGTGGEFSGYAYTHHTSVLVSSKLRSAYSTLGSMLDKLDMQLRNAEMVDAVGRHQNRDGCVVHPFGARHKGEPALLRTAEVEGCTGCGSSYRRPPLAGRVCVRTRTHTEPHIQGLGGKVPHDSPEVGGKVRRRAVPERQDTFALRGGRVGVWEEWWGTRRCLPNILSEGGGRLWSTSIPCPSSSGVASSWTSTWPGRWI